MGALAELGQLLRVLHAVVDGAGALLGAPACGRDGARVGAEADRLLRAVALAAAQEVWGGDRTVSHGERLFSSWAPLACLVYSYIQQNHTRDTHPDHGQH